MCVHHVVWNKLLNGDDFVCDIKFHDDGFDVIMYSDREISQELCTAAMDIYKKYDFFKLFKGGLKSIVYAGKEFDPFAFRLTEAGMCSIQTMRIASDQALLQEMLESGEHVYTKEEHKEILKNIDGNNI